MRKDDSKRVEREYMNKPSNNLRRWTSGLLSFAMVFLAVGSGLTWRCTDGTPCPLGSSGPTGKVSKARTFGAGSGECCKCALRKAESLVGNTRGMSGGKGCVLTSSERISSLTQRCVLQSTDVNTVPCAAIVSSKSERIQFSIPTEVCLPPEPPSGIHAGRAPPIAI
jgi:hypothetical protein